MRLRLSLGRGSAHRNASTVRSYLLGTTALSKPWWTLLQRLPTSHFKQWGFSEYQIITIQNRTREQDRSTPKFQKLSSNHKTGVDTNGATSQVKKTVVRKVIVAVTIRDSCCKTCDNNNLGSHCWNKAFQQSHRFSLLQQCATEMN